jgi:hypothetical protein
LTNITEDGEGEDRATIYYPAKQDQEETKSEPHDSNSEKED